MFEKELEKLNFDKEVLIKLINLYKDELQIAYITALKDGRDFDLDLEIEV